jgi:diadenylate cyclase
VFDFVLRDMVANFRWLDLLDIFIVYFIIYKLLLLMKGTRALQVLTGLVIFGALYFLSIGLQLLTVYELFSKFVSYLFIIIIIIFQDDIRKMLARMGKVPLFSMSSIRQENEHVIEELVKACLSLSRKKIGALIVIEQNMALTESVEIGVKMDAEVNADLIVSIFTPNAPAHDGAVIVTEGKIRAAGCFLPLTRNPNVDKSFGTRHRAAIGLAEHTDAIVLVVSEEQREISIARDGHITRGLDGPALRKALNEIYGIKEVTVHAQA